MKYALIAMVAFYLVTFGCNPKTEEEGTTSHDKVEHTAVAEKPTAPGNLTVETLAAAQTTHQAAPSNQLNTTAHKAPAAPADVQITTENVKSVTAPEKAEKNNDQWKIIAQSAATTVLALMNEEPKSEPAPVVKTPAATKDAVKSPKASETITILPCGKKVSQDVAANYPPCANNKRPAPQTALPTEEPELSEAMQKMVNATNDMVTVTRQLVMATQQMLAASKEVAVEVIDTGKDALEDAKPAVQNAVNEQEIIETVKEVVAATKEAFHATSEALSEALEAQKAQPAPSATPQQ
ncbi:MAG: hypothetical protein ACI8PB_001830 [Desulforhopalus sp.]|jgi:hypothetical protein